MKCFYPAAILTHHITREEWAQLTHCSSLGQRPSVKSKMASRQISKVTDGDFDRAESLVQSLELQANRFFSGM